MKKQLIIGAYCLLAILLFTGMFSSLAVAKEQNKPLKIVYAQIDLVNPFFISRLKGAQAKAKELGIELLVHDAQCDVARQVAAMENYIAQGVDGIIIIAVDAAAMPDVVKQATDAGIPVLGVIVQLEGQTAGCVLDEYEFGYQAGLNAGEWIAEKLGGEAEVALIGYPEMPQNKFRIQGQKDGMHELAPNAKIVAEQSANNPQDGMKAMEIILQAHPNIKVVICHSDAVAVGAYEAVMASGMDSDEFFIGGIDATPPAIEKMKENGIFRATVDMMPEQEAAKDVEKMVKMINGEKVEDEKIQFERVMWKNLDEWLAKKGE